MRHDRHTLDVPGLLEERHALLQGAERLLVLAADVARAAVAAQQASPQYRVDVVRPLEDRREAPCAFERVDRDPEVLERDRDLGRELDLTGLQRPVDRRPEVVLVGRNQLPMRLVAALCRHPGFDAQRTKEIRVPPANLGVLTRLRQLLEPELADRLEQ